MVLDTGRQTGSPIDDLVPAARRIGKAIESVIEGKPGRHPARPDRAARRGAPAHRGRARRRQDDAGQGAGPVDRLHGAAGAVHPRPAAQRHHRRERLQPGAARVRVQARAGVRQHRARRRDQPGLAQDPVGAAGVHGRAPGHGGRHHLRAARRRSWSSPPRTRWRWRARTRCPRRSGTGSPRASPSATRRPRPSWRCSTRTGPPRRWTSSSRSRGPATCRSSSPRCAGCTCPTRSRTTSSAWPTPPGRRPELRLGASPRATLHLLRASRAWAALDGRDYVIPDDVQRLARPVLAHRLLPTAEAIVERHLPEQVVDRIVAQLPLPRR